MLDQHRSWAAKKKADKKQQRKREQPIDADTEARLKAMRGGDGQPAAAGSGLNGASTSGPPLDADVDARLRALRGE